MNKNFIISIAVCSIFFGTSVLFYFNKETIIISENRYVTQFPSLPEKVSTSKLKKFFSQLSMFYNDNFPCRDKIIAATKELFPTMKTETAAQSNSIQGKDGWLFLGNAYNRTIDKLTGKFRYYETDNKKFSASGRCQYYFDQAQNILSGSKELLFLIAPNKTSIYPEFLPKEIVPAPKPFHSLLTQKMKDKGLNVYYPQKDLQAAKSKGVLYYATDTHWNSLGAYTVFMNILKQYFPEYGSLVKDSDFSFKSVPSIAGDLINIGGYVFDNQNYNDNYQAFYKNTPVSSAADFTQTNLTAYSKTENSAACIDKSIWIIGDSFSAALRPFFQQTFKTVYFTSLYEFPNFAPPYPVQADFVLYECVERNF